MNLCYDVILMLLIVGIVLVLVLVGEVLVLVLVLEATVLETSLVIAWELLRGSNILMDPCRSKLYWGSGSCDPCGVDGYVHPTKFRGSRRPLVPPPAAICRLSVAISSLDT